MHDCIPKTCREERGTKDRQEDHRALLAALFQVVWHRAHLKEVSINLSIVLDAL